MNGERLLARFQVSAPDGGRPKLKARMLVPVQSNAHRVHRREVELSIAGVKAQERFERQYDHLKGGHLKGGGA